MAWIESHQELRDHPKTIRLATRLGVHRMQAIGHLHALWWWCLAYADAGDLTEFDNLEVALGAGWDGDADVFVESLTAAGWLTADRQVHDWHDYAGKLVERRRMDAERKTSMRSFYASGAADRIKARDGDRCRYCGKTVNWADRRSGDGATYDHVVPGGPETDENIVVACRSCNTAKGGRTPEEAGMELLSPSGARNQNGSRTVSVTQPNRTVPNQTPPTPPLPAEQWARRWCEVAGLQPTRSVLRFLIPKVQDFIKVAGEPSDELLVRAHERGIVHPGGWGFVAGGKREPIPDWARELSL